MSKNLPDGDLQSRLERLEVLYTEQDNTIQALNDIISQQDREMTRLMQQIEQLHQQLSSLRSAVSGDIDPTHEPPPHY